MLYSQLVPSKRLEWKDCYSERQCTRLIVPLNYSDPKGPEAVIALIRKPSIFKEGSPLYRGPVLFNPGGPGGSGVDTVLARGDNFSTILGPQFDIVGFDPRGIARSIPRASFFKTDVERALFGQMDAGILNGSGSDGVAHAWARSFVLGRLAGETDNGYLVHINTENTARDMLSIAYAHGREKIQYWGFSYGTVLGATFAALFPDKIERMVIDGVVDSENYYATLWSNNLLDTDKAFESFLTGCANAGPEGCKFWAPTPQDIERNLTALYDSLYSKPIPMKTDKSYGLLDYSMLRSAIFGALYSPYASFSTLAEDLAALAKGDGSRIFDKASSPPYECNCDASKHAFDGLRDATVAIACNDGDDVPGDLQSSKEYYEMLSSVSGWADRWARIRLGCVGWPRFPKDHFQGPFEANTSHPILLVGNTADPVTPLWAAKKMSKGFRDSVVLTQDSAGHCSLSAPSICTQTHIRSYFLLGTLPQPGTVCQPIGTPFSNYDSKKLNKGELDEESPQQTLIASMTEDEKELFAAVSELSRNPFVPLPFFF
ncbi:TAP-like protein-domain-containing protein [Gymnopilus junonius]|uniref:TAP-like protein-domain-containing protein n=1 Tax=Gymnopilus junonius TaxID=109634 RepID=A0A9P5NT47_GYMJU|nr:TAP-like protein-domain-containing protein [Gymnopilus junonius]